MRKIIGLVLMGLGGFLITTALLALIYIPGAVKKTPLDTDSYTRLSGLATALPSGVPAGSAASVKALSHTVADGQKSDGDVVVFDTFTCLIKDPNGDAPDCVDDTDPDKRLVTATTDRFATDRRTGLSVNDEKYIGDAQPHEGLVNKFPFDVEKKTYPFWDGILDRAVDATFEGEDKVEGWDTYIFVIDVADEPAEIVSGVQGTYSDRKTMFVDPATGSIVKQLEQQKRVLENGTTVLDLDFGFTDETVKANVDSAKDSNSRLDLVGNLPLITGLLGLLALAAGFFLWNGARRADGDAVYADRDDRGPAGDGYAADDTRGLDVFGDDDATRPRSDVQGR
jgi:hypothetical protein